LQLSQLYSQTIQTDSKVNFDIYVKDPAIEKQNAQDLFDLGKKYYDLKDCDKSNSYFNKVLEITSNGDVLNSLAQTYINLNSARC
jgi:hypothetical protein